MIYLDTSVLAALYIPEPASRRAAERLTRDSPPHISSLVEVEMASLVSRRLRNKEFDLTAAQAVIREFEAHLASGAYRRLDLTLDDYRRAYSLIRRFDSSLRTLDALHVAVAQANELRLVTADRALVKSARVLSIDVELIET